MVEQVNGTYPRPVQTGFQIQDPEKGPRILPVHRQPAVMKGVQRIIIMAGTRRIIPRPPGFYDFTSAFIGEAAASGNRPEKFSEINSPDHFPIRRHQRKVAAAAQQQFLRGFYPPEKAQSPGTFSHDKITLICYIFTLAIKNRTDYISSRII